MLDFRGPPDPTVAFASGGRTASFAIAPGDTQVGIPFQTGTTAGTLTLTAQLGSSSDQLALTIPATPARVTAVQTSRAPSAVNLAVTGFDNTRTLGALSFVFYDAGGDALTPDGIHTDATADFTKYFLGSDAGGSSCFTPFFRLPVTSPDSRRATSP